jgi:hypothetical protein
MLSDLTGRRSKPVAAQSGRSQGLPYYRPSRTGSSSWFCRLQAEAGLDNIWDSLRL